MYQKVYKLIQNLRWKAFWFLNKSDNSDNIVDSVNSDNIDIDNCNNLVDTALPLFTRKLAKRI